MSDSLLIPIMVTWFSLYESNNSKIIALNKAFYNETA